MVSNMVMLLLTFIDQCVFQQKKLEDAVNMAGNFHGELNKFIAWLTETEKTLNNLQPVSRLVGKVTSQIEDHKVSGCVCVCACVQVCMHACGGGVCLVDAVFGCVYVQNNVCAV